jgi:hypothetical protein
MLSADAFLDTVMALALGGDEVAADDPKMQVNVLWVTGLALAAAALRRTNELNRERLLRNVERELRADLVNCPGKRRIAG